MGILIKNKSKIISAFFVLNFIVVLYLIINRVNYIIWSDDSAELILGKLLSDRHQILTSEWKYSSELRLFNYVLLTPILFKFIDNWYMVRIIVSILQYIIFLVVLYFFCKKIRIKDYYFLIATLSFLPISTYIFGMTAIQLFYLPHIMVVMISVIAIFHFLNKNTFNRFDKIAMYLYFIFSFYIGLSTNRFLICIHIPMLLMFFMLLVVNTFNYSFNDIIKYLKSNVIYLIVFCACMLNLFGYVFSILVLKKFFPYYNFSVAFTTFTFDKIGSFIGLVLNSFGYNTGLSVLNPKSVGNYLSFILLFLATASMIYPLFLYINKKENNSFVYNIFNLYVVFSWLAIFILYCFTDLPFTPKYILVNMFLTIVNILFFIIKFNISSFYKFIITIILFVTLTINAFFIYRYYMSYDNNSERINIKNLLLNEGYYNGLSTFLNGPILTELSNGKIDMWYTFNAPNWKIASNDSDHPLQLKIHDSTHPEGKVFIIMTNDEYEQVRFKDKLLAGNLIYSSSNFYVYGYESYDELVKNLTD